MPSLFKSTGSQKSLVDMADVLQLRKTLSRIAGAVGPAFSKVSPEFGAYMLYSFFLEKGWNVPSTGKLVPGRPHIEPAVEKHGGTIAEYVADAGMDIINAMFRSKGGLAQADIEKRWADAWTRVLNGPVAFSAREWARALGVYEFGFHIRSIHGYAYEPSPQDVAADQQTWATERAAKIKLRQERKKAKKAK